MRAPNALSAALQRFGDGFVELPLWNSRPVRTLALVLALCMFALVVTVPLEFWQQVGFVTACIVLALWLNRVKGHLATLMMVVLSVAVSSRYMYWRLTETIGLGNWVDAAFGIGLVLAELYAFVVLLLGYFQTAWPLKRRPVPMPADSATWPTVDIFIPTYNEPLSVVKPTVFAAMSMDGLCRRHRPREEQRGAARCAGALAAPTPVVRQAHAAGLFVHPYTFRPENSFLPKALQTGGDEATRSPSGMEREVQAFIAAGIDGFFTDDPALGRRAVDTPAR